MFSVFKLQEIRAASDTIGRKIITIIQKNITKKLMRNNMLIHPEIAIYFISADLLLLLLLLNNVSVANNEMNSNQKWQKWQKHQNTKTPRRKNAKREIRQKRKMSKIRQKKKNTRQKKKNTQKRRKKIYLIRLLFSLTNYLSHPN